MKEIGIYFGTDTGTTRLIGKKLARKLGDAAAKPVNVNRTEVSAFMDHDVLILGTPTYGINQLPGKSTNIANGSWEEFLPELESLDFSGKSIALYGLGDQDKYSERFVDSMIFLYQFFIERGAAIIGRWSTEGYSFITLNRLLMVSSSAWYWISKTSPCSAKNAWIAGWHRSTANWRPDMRYEPTISERAYLDHIEGEERLLYFISRTMENEEIWRLCNIDDWVTYETDGRIIMPLWPYAGLAQAAAVSGEAAEAVSLEYFLYNELNELQHEGIEMEVFPGGKPGVCMSPSRLFEIFDRKMDEEQYFIEG